MKQAQSASHAWLEAGALEALREARHGDPFAVLGLHRVGEGDSAGWALRCFLPRTEGVEVLDLDGQVLGAMERQPESDLFVAFWSGAGEPFAYRLKVTWDGGHQTQLADPYSFGPLMPEMDVWLMAQGEHQRPYEWLGAHVLDMGGVGGVRFSVWAPNARRVSVVGDFNQWDGRRHPMRLRRECGVWELFIPGVQEGDLYQFELLGADGHLRRKADPFAFKAQMRPERASVVQRLLPGLASDDKRRAANALDAPLSIYEVHLGSWRRHADGTWLTYRDMAEHLVPYAAWMGFTHIELLPVHEFPFDGSWGYQPTGLYAPTSRFGTPEDLRALIDAAHHAGLGVILDWVPGHFPSDEHGLAQFDGTHLFEHADPREGYHQDWNTLIYNYGRAEVRNFLTGNALYWIERFGVDGLRVDAVASMLYRDYSRKHGEWIPNRHGGRENLEAIDFLRRMNRLVGTLRPEAITLAEESTSFPAVSRPPSDDLQSGGLGFHYKWNMGWMNDTLAYFSKDPVYRQHHHDQIRFSLMYAFSENFVLPLSHDEVVHGKGSLLRKMPGDEWQRFANLRALYGWMWGHPGKKLLFMGCEFAQADEWNADRSLDWHLTHHPLHGGVQRLVRRLNQTLRGLTALHEQDADPAGFSWVSHEDAAHSMLAFLRRDRWGRSALVVSNLTPVVRHGWRVGVPCGGIWHTWVNTDDAEFGGSGVVQASVEASPVEWQGHAQSIVLTLPPLATLILSPDVPGEPS